MSTAKCTRLVENNYDVIKKAKPDVSKNSAGYYLWNVWDKEKGVFDLTKLVVGSQGTLGASRGSQARPCGAEKALAACGHIFEGCLTRSPILLTKF